MKKSPVKAARFYHLSFWIALVLAFSASLAVLLFGLKMLYVPAVIFAVVAIIAFNCTPVFYNKAAKYKKEARKYTALADMAKFIH